MSNLSPGQFGGYVSDFEYYNEDPETYPRLRKTSSNKEPGLNKARAGRVVRAAQQVRRGPRRGELADRRYARWFRPPLEDFETSKGQGYIQPDDGSSPDYPYRWSVN